MPLCQNLLFLFHSNGLLTQCRLRVLFNLKLGNNTHDFIEGLLVCSYDRTCTRPTTIMFQLQHPYNHLNSQFCNEGQSKGYSILTLEMKSKLKDGKNLKFMSSMEVK